MPRTLSFTLKEWIEKEGASAIAKKARVSPAAVRYWKHGYVLPDSTTMYRLKKISKNVLSIDKTFEAHFSAANRKNRYQHQHQKK